jgi:hypothetical protein
VTHFGNHRDVLDRELQTQEVAALLKRANKDTPYLFLGYLTNKPYSHHYNVLTQVTKQIQILFVIVCLFFCNTGWMDRHGAARDEQMVPVHLLSQSCSLKVNNNNKTFFFPFFFCCAVLIGMTLAARLTLRLRSQFSNPNKTNIVFLLSFHIYNLLFVLFVFLPSVHHQHVFLI